MQSRIPYSGKGEKNTAKKELFSRSERCIKAKKRQTLPEEASPTT